MSEEKVFKTKTGFCHILPDKIVLTRDGVIGDLAKITTGNNINQILFVYGAISTALLYFTFQSYQRNDLLMAVIYVALAVFLIFGIIRSWNNSATPILERNKIKEIKFFSAQNGFTRAYFEVYFDDDKGQLKKRLIMLPGSLSGDSQETQKALQIMQEEDLITK